MLKKLTILAAMLAMGLLVAAPAIAQVGQENDQEGESGEIDQSFTVTGGSSNGNSCAPLQGSAQSGNSQNGIGVIQSDESEADDFEFEEVGSDITSSGSNSTECKQEVNQAAAATAGEAKEKKAAPAPKPAPAPAPKTAPAPAPKAETPQAKAQASAPAPAPKAAQKKAEQRQLPKTGGDLASLFTLGAGALLVAGGILVRKLVK